MTVRPRARHARRALLAILAAAALAVGVLIGGSGATLARAATQGPCDIYGAGGTPCVAAHSTTRALYGAYDGPLYQVKRASDSTTTNIDPLSAGGVANAAAQNSFCAGTTCVITEIFDQSGNGNNLTDAPAGGAAGGPDGLANATSAPVTVDGHQAYGVYIAAGDGYRDDSTKDIATGNNSEGEYDVLDGTHYDNGCCFDYGNAETNNHADGDGAMEAIYFGTEKTWGTGSGNGPWIMADMENGLFSGQGAGLNSADPTTNYRFTTAMIEGGANQWAILGGNGQSGSLSTDYSGVRPAGYNPMKKQGAIILGIGGDNSNGSSGTFYEGAMTSGYPTAATEAAVQANIVAAGYESSSTPSGAEIHATGAGQCLDVPGGTTTEGTQLDIWDCNGGSNQIWTHTSANQLTVYSGADCLDAYKNGTTAGTAVDIWPCTGSANQQWTVNSNGTITGVQSGLCLDVTGASTKEGALVELWTCNGHSNQQWVLN